MKSENLRKMINDKTISTESLILENKLNALFDSDKENREDRVGMHGSGIIASDSDFCYRQQVLSFFYKGFEGEIPIGLKRVFLEGWHIHEKWQKLFMQTGVARGIEQRGVSNEWKLLFTPDAIIELDGKTYVVEIKSVNTFSFKHMKTHPSGEKQCRLYMHFTGIPRGFVLAEDKNTQEIKVIPVDYDPVKVKPYVERMYKVKGYIKRYEEEGKLPSKMCNSSKCKMADRCSYRDACFNLNKVPLDEKQMIKLKKNWKKLND